MLLRAYENLSENVVWSVVIGVHLKLQLCEVICDDFLDSESTYGILVSSWGSGKTFYQMRSVATLLGSSSGPVWFKLLIIIHLQAFSFSQLIGGILKIHKQKK